LVFFFFHNYRPSAPVRGVGWQQTEKGKKAGGGGGGGGGGKGGRCVGLTTLPPLCVDCLKIWEPQSPRTLRAGPGLERDYFTFYFYGYTCIVTDVILSYVSPVPARQRKPGTNYRGPTMLLMFLSFTVVSDVISQ